MPLAPATALAPADPARLASYRACHAVTRTHARSFHFASFVLPPARREAAYAVYAFCRAADDAIDEAEGAGPAELQARLQALHRRLDAIWSDRGIQYETDQALADVARRFGLERSPFEQLLEGMAIDLEPVRFRTQAQLDDYCFKVAGVVGHMLLPVLGASSPLARARAADLGTAMQLTNILRDVGEDLDRGRIYLPEEELRRFGLSHADFERRAISPAWRAFAAAQIARARAYYARADRGIPLIETWGGRLCTRVMRLVYGDLLHQIERARFDTFSGRVRTSTPRKLALLSFAIAGVVPPSARVAAPAQADGPLALASSIESQ